MLPLIRDVYDTYKGDEEPHVLRLFVMVLASLAVAIFSVDLPDHALPAMALAISVLAGFTFTSLFSSHALATFDLPPPNSESDRNDLRTLKTLSVNFRSRSRLFILLAVTDLIGIIYLSLDFSGAKGSFDWVLLQFPSLNYNHIYESLTFGLLLLRSIISFVVVFIFLECLYTFYRLAETIVSVVDIRRDYIEK